MSSPIADGVMAATHKLVQQAMTGQWQDVPKTIEERRVLLERLAAGATPQDQPWLNALQQAMSESDAAVAKMTDGRKTWGAGPGPAQNEAATSHSPDSPGGAVDSMMDMIRLSR